MAFVSSTNSPHMHACRKLQKIATPRCVAMLESFITKNKEFSFEKLKLLLQGSTFLYTRFKFQVSNRDLRHYTHYDMDGRIARSN